jgi:rRNA maturation endonuclease Nob1
MNSEVEAAERKKLVGYCENCEHYTKYIVGVNPEVCEVCGGKFSTQHGHQITTQRTFNVSKTAKKGKSKNAGA